MLALGKLLELTLAGREPTEKIQLTADGTRLHWLAEGALEVTPIAARDTGLDLLISAGIHGNETAPIELLDRLLRRIASGQLKPAARVLFLLGNPQALRQGERYLELDMNRLFCGQHSDAAGDEALRAAELECLAASFFREPRRRLHYDLHTAIRGSQIEQFALYPWREGRAHSQEELQRLANAGIQAVLLQQRPGITFSAYTYSCLEAEAFTLELGRARPFGKNQEVKLDALETVLEQLIEGDEAATLTPASSPQLFSVSQEVIKHSEHFRLHLEANVENFTKLEPGYLLAEDSGGLRWRVEEPNTRVVFPNPRVKNGLRAAILVVPTQL